MKNAIMAGALGLSLFVMSCDQKKTDDKIEGSVETTQAAKTNETDNYTAGNSIPVATEAVPQEVRTGFSTKYPNIKTYEWSRYEPSESDDLDKDFDYYVVRFNNDGVDYMDWYNSKGEWVKNSTILDENPSLPAAVNDYLHTNYVGYEVEEIEKGNDKNVEIYEIQMKKGDDKVKIKITPQGEVVKEK